MNIGSAALFLHGYVHVKSRYLFHIHNLYYFSTPHYAPSTIAFVNKAKSSYISNMLLNNYVFIFIVASRWIFVRSFRKLTQLFSILKVQKYENLSSIHKDFRELNFKNDIDNAS